tara:strand:- start:3486 stop:3911 length:426 start_codon:yes stop_codon:yes gene_type:complete
MVNMLSNFKGFIAVVIILLFTQQSFAAYVPMNCDDMKNATIASSYNYSHLTAQMTQYGQYSFSKDKNSSHEECNVCNSGDCTCNERGGCLSATISISTQTIKQMYTLFADHGNRYTYQEECPNSGVYLHLFKPPIHILPQD